MTDSDIDNLGVDAFAAETLLARTQALAKEIEGVLRADDLEYVHRMRVASRRLRTALTIFADRLPAKKADNWQRDVRRVTRALGEARDCDVQIALVESTSAEVTDRHQRPGLSRLLLRLRQRRDALQSHVERAVKRLGDDRVIPEMEDVLRVMRVRDRLQPAPNDPACLHALLCAAIVPRVIDLLSYEPYVSHPERIAELHAMRIAAKQLRYTLEIFSPVHHDGLKNYIKLARTLQEILGDMHDCDVWALALPRFLDDERALALAYAGTARAVARLAPGIQALADDRAATRAARYQDLVAAWPDAKTAWETLLTQLAPANPPEHAH